MWQLQKQKQAKANAEATEAGAAPVGDMAQAIGEGGDAARSAALLSLKVQVHRELLDEINLAQLDKMSRAQIETEAGDVIANILGRHQMALTAAERRLLVSDVLDELLQRPEFVDYWSHRWSDLLLVNGDKLSPTAMWSYYNWIRRHVAANTSWDAMVRDLLTATGSTLEHGGVNFFVLNDEPTKCAETVSVEDFITDDIIDRYWELYRIPGNRQAAGERWTVDREPQYADRIGEIAAPTLILWGKEDPLIHASAATTFKERLPQAEVVIYDGVGHLPMEEVPDKTAADIDAFLSRVLTPASETP